MNTVSIFQRRWTDIVFEGRNQAYGAYQLRRESARTTLAAFFYSLMIVASACGIFMLINLLGEPSAIPKAPEPVYPTLRPVTFRPLTNTPSAPKVPQKATAPVYVPSAEPETQPTQPEPQQNDAPGSDGGTPTGTPATGGETGIPTMPSIPEPLNTVEIPASLDRQPAFPGGLDEFYGFVGKNFRPVETEGQTIRVFVSFVIEKDGSLSDIKVLRDPGFGAGKEAIRVLRSLKTKWEPGMIKGKPVRTSYTMPITVKPGS